MNASTDNIFSCSGVKVTVEDKLIVKGVDMEVGAGEIHAFMGPNGSGKSTFASGLMGHPHMTLEGKVFMDGEPIHDLPTNERAKAGLFLGFQYPAAIPGVTVSSFLRASLQELRGEKQSVFDFRKELDAAFKALGVPWSFADRYLNDGFSGGEKKRLEILQMSLMKPKFVILDEIDSGLDVDALKTVAQGIREAAQGGAGVLLVTHYQRLLDLAIPDKVHYFMDGRVVLEGDAESVHNLEEQGYDWLKRNAAARPAEGVA